MNISLTYSPWFVVLCILVALVGTALLYWRDRSIPDLKSWMRWGLAALRFAGLLILALLLLEPLLRYLQTEVQQPIVVLAQDNSSSLLIGKDSTYYKEEYLPQLQDLRDKLSEQYEVQQYTFGAEVNRDGTVDYTEGLTDFSGLSEELENRFANRNLGAVVVASDGIYNRGRNPVFSFDRIESPIYTIAMGDTSRRRDILVREVLHNDLAYLGNRFPVEVIVEANQLDGATAQLQIVHNGNVEAQSSISVDSERFMQRFSFKLNADEVGTQRYSVRLTGVGEELSESNNSRDIFVDVLDSRQKILLLANSPHPDLHAIRAALSQKNAYEIELAYADDWNGDIKPYSLIVMHQLPSSRNPVKGLAQKLADQRKPVWMIIGSSTNTSGVSAYNMGVEIDRRNRSLNEVTPRLNKGYSLFTLPEDLNNYVRELPPLSVPFGEFTAATGMRTLFYQNIGNVETDQPLMGFSEVNSRKSAITAGEGIWRWRMSLYARTESHDIFNSLVSKTVQYLSAREDRRLFRVENPARFAENESVVIRAELYNEAYEPVNESDVDIVIKDADGNEYPFAFNRTSRAYRLDAGMLSPGVYSYTATAHTPNGDLTDSGSFTVTELALEAASTRANHRILYQLSEGSGGKMYFPSQLDSLASALQTSQIKPVSYERETLASIINLRWIFFIILGLLAIEWFIRKRQGAY